MLDFSRYHMHPEGDDRINRGTELLAHRPTDTYGFGSVEGNSLLHHVESSEWFSGRWSCKGGDWKRNDELSQDKPYRKKLVLNEGFPLCQMPKYSHEDARRHCKDELYCPVHMKKLDLPLWAFSSTEDDTDSVNDASTDVVIPGRSGQIRQPPKGVKGTMLSVVSINAHVVKDQPSVEPWTKHRGADQTLSRSSRSHSIGADRNSVHEGLLHSKKHHEYGSQGLHKSKSVPDIPKDRVCTMEELSVNQGDWYYLDGTGHEHGPFSYSELQELVKKGIIIENSSVFCKIDNTWLPVMDLKQDSAVRSAAQSSDSSSARMHSDQYNFGMNRGSGSFHELHPQFVGYTRGKLHELVMKYFKSRELTLAINEVLDPWISAKQPKKEIETYFSHNSASRNFLSGTVPHLAQHILLSLLYLDAFEPLNLSTLTKQIQFLPDKHHILSSIIFLFLCSCFLKVSYGLYVVWILVTFSGYIAEDGGSAKRARLLSDQNEDIHVADDIHASQKEDICFEELMTTLWTVGQKMKVGVH
jgi:[histone H3]-lysine4 N-trimethyltransferase ATXR3